MDINQGGWVPGIEGDGALVSGLGASSTEQTGVYTPVLQVSGNMSVSFTYQFNQDVSSRRWLKLYLVDFDNNIYAQLDSLELTGKLANTTYTYTNNFNNLPSFGYRLYINYQGIGGTIRIAIDQLQTDIPLVYAEGCNQSPVAVSDVITGLPNFTASGNLRVNDYDPNNDWFAYYLINNSADGTVSLNSDGTFTFVPTPGFSGHSTTFTYQICDYGYGPLCSAIVTVTINFPTANFPVKLVDFSASINDDKEVILHWTTATEQNTDRFDIERSFDGVEFKKIGQVKANGNAQRKIDYEFNDNKIRNNTLYKKDVYYRLRTVDLNSRTETSKVLVIRMINTVSTNSIAVTPNPVRNDINVQVQLRENSYVVMKITNSAGTEILRKSLHASAGMNSFLLENTNRLRAGVYMLEVIVNSSERMITRLIKN